MTKLSPKPNKLQKAAAKVYAQGDFAFPRGVKNWRENIQGTDPLFAFLLSELATDQHCSDRETALQRLRMAADDIAVVIQAIQGIKP